MGRGHGFASGALSARWGSIESRVCLVRTVGFVGKTEGHGALADHAAQIPLSNAHGMPLQEPRDLIGGQIPAPAQRPDRVPNGGFLRPTPPGDWLSQTFQLLPFLGSFPDSASRRRALGLSMEGGRVGG